MKNIVRLGDIFNLQMGKTPSRDNNFYWEKGKYDWASISDLSICGKYIFDTKEKISELAIKESGIKLVPVNTLIMSFKLSLGKVAITKKNIYTNEAIMAFIPNKKFNVLSDYFLYLFSFKDWEKETNRAVKGITLNKSILNEVKVNLPPLEEQKRIANILDKVTEIIEKRKNQLDKLDLLIKAKFVEMFGDPVKNEKDWKTMLLLDVTNKIASGSTPKGGKQSYISEGIALIRSMNIYDGAFQYKELAHITEEQAKQLENVIIEKQDVLINITGASVTRCCIVPIEILPARVNQHVMIVRCLKDILNNIFLNYHFINISYKNKLIHIAEASGATRQALTKQQIENLKIIVPPIELQEKFAKFVEQTEKAKIKINESLENLETLKKALMQEYFDN